MNDLFGNDTRNREHSPLLPSSTQNTTRRYNAQTYNAPAFMQRTNSNQSNRAFQPNANQTHSTIGTFISNIFGNNSNARQQQYSYPSARQAHQQTHQQTQQAHHQDPIVTYPSSSSSSTSSRAPSPLPAPFTQNPYNFTNIQSNNQGAFSLIGNDEIDLAPNINALSVVQHHDDNETEVRLRTIQAKNERVKLRNEDKQNQRNHVLAMQNQNAYANLIPGSTPLNNQDRNNDEYIEHLCRLNHLNPHDPSLSQVGYTNSFKESINKQNYKKSIICYGVQQYKIDPKTITVCFHDSRHRRIRMQMVGGWSFEVINSAVHSDILLIRFLMDNRSESTEDLKIEILDGTNNDKQRCCRYSCVLI